MWWRSGSLRTLRGPPRAAGIPDAATMMQRVIDHCGQAVRMHALNLPTRVLGREAQAGL